MHWGLELLIKGGIVYTALMNMDNFNSVVYHKRTKNTNTEKDFLNKIGKINYYITTPGRELGYIANKILKRK